MTSDRKIKSNRANARVSTGPKAGHGRARSAKNAYRHGLSLSVRSDQALDEQVQVLASQIAGPRASTHIQVLALRVAEAQIDLRRVRDSRHQFLPQQLTNLDDDTRANKKLKSMDRYERRARSRRKFAVRAFDAARRRDPAL